MQTATVSSFRKTICLNNPQILKKFPTTIDTGVVTRL